MPEPDTSQVLDLLGLPTTTTTTSTVPLAGADRGGPQPAVAAPRPGRRRWVWVLVAVAVIAGLVAMRLTVGADSRPRTAAEVDARWCAAWQNLISYSNDQRPVFPADGSLPSGASYLAYLDRVAQLNTALLDVSPPALVDAHKALNDYSTAQTAAAHQKFDQAGEAAFMTAESKGLPLTTDTFPIDAFKVLNTYQKAHCAA